MTKDAYFEMCQMLGQEPIESEIPVEMDDFPPLVQQCFSIYNILTDNWDTMGGNYLGKDYSILFNLFEVYMVDKTEHLLALQILLHMDYVRTKMISDKLKNKAPSSSR
jgi:hypothetical protein